MTQNIQYFIMHGMRLCIKIYDFVTHMFYALSFIHNTEVPSGIK